MTVRTLDDLDVPAIMEGRDIDVFIVRGPGFAEFCRRLENEGTYIGGGTQVYALKEEHRVRTLDNAILGYAIGRLWTIERPQGVGDELA